MYPEIVLKKGKERSVLNFHPWIFSGAIEKQDPQLSDGDLTDVYSYEGKYLATGHFNKGSITVRLVCFHQQIIDEQFWFSKIKVAYELRQLLNLTENQDTNCYRLIHGEGDGMPGLIADFYANTVVMQCHTIGMYRIRNEIAACLRKLYGSTLNCIFDKSTDTLHKQTGTETANTFLFGNVQSQIVKENGLQFYVDWVNGQKTGFFIDQRESRKLLQQYSKGKKVLNTFAYSGGFSLYALQAEAQLVHSVDSSKHAGDLGVKNVQINFEQASHEFFVEDVFDFLKKSEVIYDVMVLDPPAFAKHLDAVKRAAIGYKKLNLEAFRRIAKNGVVFTFSCSQAIDKTLFRQIVFGAAAQAGRKVRILHQLHQPPDHPINIYHPEGEYLKGLVLHVE